MVVYLVLVVVFTSGVRFFVDVTMSVSTPGKLKNYLSAMVVLKGKGGVTRATKSQQLVTKSGFNKCYLKMFTLNCCNTQDNIGQHFQLTCVEIRFCCNFEQFSCSYYFTLNPILVVIEFFIVVVAQYM